MKLKTAELTEAALDWAVARAWQPVYSDRALIAGLAAGYDDVGNYHEAYSPSTNWAQGGLIIERESISVIRCDDNYEVDAKGYCASKRIPVWAAAKGQQCSGDIYGPQGDDWGTVYQLDTSECVTGVTPLIAAMRCYVTNKLGKEVDVPDELTQ